MLEKLISRIREEKGITKTDVAKLSGINVGHITHIELGTRRPSHKTLRVIAKALNVPFQPLYQSFDKTLDEQQLEYNYIKHIEYKKIPAFSDLDLIDCPANFSNASFAYRTHDNAMAPLLKQNTYAFVEINTPVKNKEIGFFKVNDDFVIRKLIYKKGNFILKANDKSVEDIVITENDEFSILGKVYI